MLVLPWRPGALGDGHREEGLTLSLGSPGVSSSLPAVRTPLKWQNNLNRKARVLLPNVGEMASPPTLQCELQAPGDI